MELLWNFDCVQRETKVQKFKVTLEQSNFKAARAT